MTMYHLLSDWNRGTASCAVTPLDSIAKLHQTEDVEQPANTSRRASCYQIGVGCSWRSTTDNQNGLTNRGYAGVRWTACALGLAVQRQRWGDGGTLTTHSQSTATNRNNGPPPLKWQYIVWRTQQKKKVWHHFGMSHRLCKHVEGSRVAWPGSSVYSRIWKLPVIVFGHCPCTLHSTCQADTARPMPFGI